MTTKHIRATVNDQGACDVCGRTLLRGEQAQVYISGGTRKSVCELCNSKAIHEGWVREGALPAYGSGGSGGERRRSLFGRLRSRRDDGGGARDDQSAARRDAELPSPLPSRRGELAATGAGGGARAPRAEPRHVRAVPSSDEQRLAAAVDRFNVSPHRQTISGVARSLGAPVVNLAPDELHPGLVTVVVSWELCWYRYEVDLSDDGAGVRLGAQGYELTDLSDVERLPNATADDLGQLELA